MIKVKKYKVIKNSGIYKDMTVGVVIYVHSASHGDGWRYFPWSSAVRPSRITHASAELALRRRVTDYNLVAM